MCLGYGKAISRDDDHFARIAHRYRRVRSLGVGTVVGEMALMYQQRSATVVADEDVESYALAKSAYVSILRDHPAIAAKLLANILHDTMERLRTTSDQLRVMGR